MKSEQKANSAILKLKKKKQCNIFAYFPFQIEIMDLCIVVERKLLIKKGIW